MLRPDPNIRETQPVIRQLDEAAINRIAAGEVVERPASAVKELVENALDAGATRVEVTIADGGKTLIRVQDNGCGMSPESLPLALERHATSKIDGSDLLNIHSFGFRGEALPSLAAVGRLSLTSRAQGHDAAEIRISGSRSEGVRPAALNGGTVVELRDLFYATPARLKFLRTDRAETQAVTDVIKRLAMAEPFVGFTLRDTSGGNARVLFRADAETGDLFDALHGRLQTILGREFAENALKIDASRDGLHMTGYAALPTYSRGAAVAQFLFVNGRPVKDKLLTGALRAAYFDFLSRDRHPAAALFLECEPVMVDVNVHPAKSEVRFRDPASARGLIVSGLRHALAEAGHRASTTVAGATLEAFRPEPSRGFGGTPPERPSAAVLERATSWQAPETAYDRVTPEGRPFVYQAPERREAPAPYRGGMAESLPSFETAPSARFDTPAPAPELEAHPLGAARAQVHENYIIAQTTTGMVIVDQHAAHERLVYEKLKRQMAENGVASQALLIPEIVELSQPEAARLLEAAEDLAKLGLHIEAFGGTAIAVRETPAILGEINAEAMLRDVLDELNDQDDSLTLQARIEAILSRVACHGSIRSGRRMQVAEMNELLRQMEATPHSGQCNHGRPTYVELKLSDIERLFGRT
ncbi:DNA mismatch repair endonuclease MutL [Pseudooceanicola sp. CBS1P-1]|uniref:DNA mismatch repair protein MutL n=1 Tax=Pseudooceanicola albus TaxID=2692189 RepID=A0A6L7GA87_9RHOB|nr:MULTISPECIES: DNA mismatch repair endonuclease MutL [Pseudooceanicola]MBT9386667.1 DNA mismatch repair endonuclease MutL [Pseudooceanicola endophyticus]MXN20921.1 DNA mismatch repair endonuclease MutL [Pseudooceanicola albus]